MTSTTATRDEAQGLGVRLALGYGAAILLPALALAAEYFIYSRVGAEPSPFLLVYPAVFLIVWFAGRGPGIVATILGALGAWYLFMPPVHSFAVPPVPDLLKLGVFLLMGGLFSGMLPSSRKRAEAALRRQALRNEMLLRSANDGIHVLDSNGDVLEANDVFCSMLGYSHAEALELNVAQWDARWSPQELMSEIIPRVLQGRQVFETKHRRRDGRIIDVEVSTAGVEIDGVRVLFAASRDITERKRAERELARTAAELTEANRLKDVFTDVLRHDILTPITAVMLSLELLEGMESDPNKTDLLKRARQSARNVAEMTENAARLAAVTAGHALQVVAADPTRVLRSVLPDLEHKLREKDMTLTDQSTGGFSARFSPLMKDVFANLLSNAIKYSPRGTRIDFGVEDRGDSWVLYVRDQGEGIADKYKQTIFNRFERLGKEGVKGSGLGLTITKQIVSLHGGEIWVEDNPTGGSVFFVKIPKSPPES